MRDVVRQVFDAKVPGRRVYSVAMETRERTAYPLEGWIAAGASLLFTVFFFLEYLTRRVYIPFDLPSYHFPLADYAFLALKHGRFPEWDPSNYSGMPFAANPQAALFYPGTWLLFAANWQRTHLSYVKFELFIFAHVWFAWMLCYAWLRRRLGVFASVCGAAIFGYGGYMMTEMQHLGLIVGYAWIPLGLMGIDEAADTESWRPLWKTAAASALAFLGGYTPTWFVVVVCFLSYAALRPRGWKVGLQCCAAIGVSACAVAIQLLPTVQWSSMRLPEARYGLGYRDPAFYISYLIPNFYNFGPHLPIDTNSGFEYFYLGVPGIVGLLLLPLLRRREGAWSAAPLVGMFCVCAVFVTNPFDLVSRAVLHSTLIAQICRSYYFLAGLTAAAAPLAAIGIDRLFARLSEVSLQGKSGSWRQSRAAAFLVLALLIVHSARLLYIWRFLDFAPGWAGAWDVGFLAMEFLAGLWLLCGQSRRLRVALSVALLLTIGVDYKVHGTSKRMNSSPDAGVRTDSLPGMNAAVMRQLEADSVYRFSLDQTAPQAVDFRHFSFTTPQGFDPFLTGAYSQFIKTTGTFRSNWDLAIDPNNLQGMQTLGIGYFISSEQGPQIGDLRASSHLRLMQPDDSFYKVFEVIEKRPPYGVDGADATIERTRWEPEHRAFVVNAKRDGKFYLSEQWHPGWRARVDGRGVPIERWKGAFQAVPLEAGEHRVEFDFKDEWLRVGAAISFVTLVGAFVALRRLA